MRNNQNETLNPSNRQEWRDWLNKNYNSCKGIWLTIHKKESGKRGISLDEATEEAVSFGWIDSQLKVVDKDSYLLRFTPRKKGSVWSKNNKLRVKKLTAMGLMTPAGLQKVDEAQEDGSWNRLDEVDNLRVPEDLQSALLRKSAEKNFGAFSDSAKRQILWWILSAKRAETRQKRVDLVADMAAHNKKPF